ncbi:conserved hypothetical protein (plasmid) [Allorhizobium ampelinum S4]|uniref:Uncharacterized protein n=1 Tax=Allorhizobium ampelinum (strain ATCC BAA-846 / DSM 112012 / S4) TaxID=311402 RepID=B9K352_ALLAM|nr:hypothetical protein [Allorhizobium ampelinum]ACM39300.1 conserved hypothetical protein [Allorhizobium ampelinum S4]
MSTIGDLERRAGIGPSREERAAFWLRFRHLDGIACLKAGVAELERLIAMKKAAEPTAELTERKSSRRNRLPPLTDEQERALQAYAAKHGRRWKSVLSNAWMGEAPYDDGPLLRYLRNTRGPSWLVTYRLPKAPPSTAPR